MTKKKAATLVSVALCCLLLLAACTPTPNQITTDVEGQEATIFEHEIRMTIGDTIVLGRITDELADLGTVKKGNTASYKIIIRNSENNPVKVVPSASGNISELIDFDYQEVIEGQSSAEITIRINADAEKGFYSGLISVRRGS